MYQIRKRAFRIRPLRQALPDLPAGAPEYRRDRHSLDSYYVTTSSGESIPVASLAEVTDTVGTAYVSQFNLYRSVSLTVTPAARASTTDVMHTIERTAAAVLPSDVGMAWSGLSYQRPGPRSREPRSMRWRSPSLSGAGGLYESWGLPLAIMLSVPAAVLGALLFTGGMHLFDPLYVNDVYLQISLVMLIGLAAKNAILVVEYADRLFREQGMSLMDAAVGAAASACARSS